LNFFEHQSLARRNSRVMVVLFLLAVAAVVAAVDCVLAAIYLMGSSDAAASAVPQSVYVWGAVVTAGTIFVVSLIHVTRLGGGGAVVAAMAGARPVASNSTDPLERRLVNIVEEMAIASGVRVPQVYIMDKESGINAFAAGWEVSNAVVAVTRGALETLNRDELQGVVGHEFSHILNGDMRLNIRMLGVLAGIVFLGSIGEFVIRSVRGTKEKEALAVLLIGVALFIIGYVGLFFARLIKAAVSRQREYLADASSVELTRNPHGLEQALAKIASDKEVLEVANRATQHLYFENPIKKFEQRSSKLFDTHPPVLDRVNRLRSLSGQAPATSLEDLLGPPISPLIGARLEHQ
jgi:Zn-dependent protease with chaperone function